MNKKDSESVAVGYMPRLLDDYLGELLGEGLPAMAIDGPKSIGKTETAKRLAQTVFSLEDRKIRESVINEPRLVTTAPSPVLIDEWQKWPDIWNYVRTAVDEESINPESLGASFLLTGSAYPPKADIHSGAGRIVHIRMRPMSLQERQLESPTVSIAACLSGRQKDVLASTMLSARDYLAEITRSGFPAIRMMSDRIRPFEIEGYLDNIVNREFGENGYEVRRPSLLLQWLKAYAAATGTTASYTEILDAATPGENYKPSKKTSLTYRNALESLWLLDEVQPWIPSGGQFSRLKQTAKHFLADPALTACLLDLDADMLLNGGDDTKFDGAYGIMVGRLFEALVAQSLQTYALVNDAKVGHLRTQNGDHEVDFIVHKGRKIVAIEVKFSPLVDDVDVKHLTWLKDKYGENLTECIVVTTGPDVYRRKKDGVLVVPAALLGA